MSRIIAAIVLVAVLAVGGGIIATTAYQAGLSTAVTTVTDGGTVVAPVVVPAYGYGYGWHGFGIGFGFFGFLFTLFFLFIVFGLIRAIFWGGRRRGGGWGPGWDPDARRDHFASKFHGTFEDWHRQAHDATPPPTGSSPTGNPPASGPPTSTPPAG